MASTTSAAYPHIIRVDEPSDGSDPELTVGEWFNIFKNVMCEINSNQDPLIDKTSVNPELLEISEDQLCDQQSYLKIEEQIINNEELLQLCQFCLKPGNLSLYQHELPLTQIFKYIGLRVNLNKNYPGSMCQSCDDRIKEISTFIHRFKGFHPYLYEDLGNSNLEQISQRYKNTCSFCLASEKPEEVKTIHSQLVSVFNSILCQKELDFLIKKKLPEKLCSNCTRCLIDIKCFVEQAHLSVQMVHKYIIGIRSYCVPTVDDAVTHKSKNSGKRSCTETSRDTSGGLLPKRMKNEQEYLFIDLQDETYQYSKGGYVLKEFKRCNRYFTVTLQFVLFVVDYSRSLFFFLSYSQVAEAVKLFLRPYGVPYLKHLLFKYK